MKVKTTTRPPRKICAFNQEAMFALFVFLYTHYKDTQATNDVPYFVKFAILLEKFGRRRRSRNSSYSSSLPSLPFSVISGIILKIFDGNSIICSEGTAGHARTAEKKLRLYVRDASIFDACLLDDVNHSLLSVPDPSCTRNSVCPNSVIEKDSDLLASKKENVMETSKTMKDFFFLIRKSLKSLHAALT